MWQHDEGDVQTSHSTAVSLIFFFGVTHGPPDAFRINAIEAARTHGSPRLLQSVVISRPFGSMVLPRYLEPMVPIGRLSLLGAMMASVYHEAVGIYGPSELTHGPPEAFTTKGPSEAVSIEGISEAYGFLMFRYLFLDPWSSQCLHESMVLPRPLWPMVLPRLFNQCLLETFWNHGPPEAFGTNALSEACWMHALTELFGVISRLEVSL